MRFNFRCVVTGETANLVCHHLNSWDWCITVEGRYDINNGVVVTKEIHDKFHKVYGGGQNTPSQFNDFLKKNYNLTENSWQHGNHEPSLTTEKLQERRLTQAQQLHESLLKLIKSRNHVLVSGVYENSTSIIEVRCLIHNPLSPEEEDDISSSKVNQKEGKESVVRIITHKTTATNYKKSKTGMPCCGRAIQSQVTAYHNTL
uniref:Putative HNH homing endonuclease n=1 Tax=Chloromonas perforata TaxID=51730 RepID=A0A0S2LPI5_9CHLO|nr:putative HNH homing endonuclease [Chloromonas perforata]